mmetsp:Transcript_47391/g.125141  ORF Transcript_47391/g.125141 Transcript_47391/m.125141 type:complete len:238 (+) Transcript_47391:77-790(+)
MGSAPKVVASGLPTAQPAATAASKPTPAFIEQRPVMFAAPEPPKRQPHDTAEGLGSCGPTPAKMLPGLCGVIASSASNRSTRERWRLVPQRRSSTISPQCVCCCCRNSAKATLCLADNSSCNLHKSETSSLHLASRLRNSPSEVESRCIRIPSSANLCRNSATEASALSILWAMFCNATCCPCKLLSTPTSHVRRRTGSSALNTWRSCKMAPWPARISASSASLLDNDTEEPPSMLL